jgi:hypothetical protein
MPTKMQTSSSGKKKFSNLFVPCSDIKSAQRSVLKIEWNKMSDKELI